jgi:hypothetical protein
MQFLTSFKICPAHDLVSKGWTGTTDFHRDYAPAFGLLCRAGTALAISALPAILPEPARRCRQRSLLGALEQLRQLTFNFRANRLSSRAQNRRESAIHSELSNLEHAIAPN